MTRRPSGYHPALLGATWLAGGAIAVLVGFGAVQLVGDEVTQRSTSPISQRDIANSVAGLSPSASTPSTQPSRSTEDVPAPIPGLTGPTPTTGRPPTPTGQGGAATATSRVRSFMLTGGQVVVSCTGSKISLRYAVPANGFRSEVHVIDPQHIEASFESPTHQSRLSASCRGGVPFGTAEEEQESGEHLSSVPGP